MPYYIFACPECSEPRYRTRMDVPPGTKATPELFEPVGGQKTQPDPAVPPVCDLCSSQLVLVVEGGKQKPDRNSAPLAGTGAQREEIKPSAPKAQPVSDIKLTSLLELEPDEAMIEVKPLPGQEAYLLITSKRLLKLEV